VSGSAGDELLRWVSEAGSGSWERLRDVCAFLAQKHRLKMRPWVLASGLAALGHIDIDWRTRSWSVAPPALNIVPGLGLCVVLTGSRPHYLDRRFDTATDDLDVFPFDIPQPPWPAARLAKCSSIEMVHQVAEGIRARVEVDPATGLVAALRPVDEEPIEFAPEPSLEEAQRFDPESLRWVPAVDRAPGLYRVDLHGRPIHRQRLEDGTWLAVDLPVGQFLSIRGKRHVLRWRQPSERRPSALEVERGVSLPLIAERAATVSSGLAPQNDGDWRRYLNVPHSIAAGIAEALLQELQVV
jgi:hypothetical protein